MIATHIGAREALYSSIRSTEKCVISMRDRVNLPRPQRKDWHDILSLSFVDTNNEIYLDGPSLMDATEIVRFAERHRDRDMVVHCEQGVSRSTAVCLGLEAMGWTVEWRKQGARNANPTLVKHLSFVLGKPIIIPDYELGIWAKGILRW